MGTSSGLGLKAGAQWGQGTLSRTAADATAAQYDSAARGVQMSSTLAAEEEQRKSRLLQSRALAVAAASGAGASDSDVLKIISDLAAEGEYRSLVTKYEGEEKARGLRQRADVMRYEGQIAERAGRFNAVSTLLTGAKSMYEKYGERGPDPAFVNEEADRYSY